MPKRRAHGDLPPETGPVLPRCVEDVARAVERLHRACLRPFPQFETKLPTLDDATKLLRRANEWAEEVERAYGRPVATKGFETSVLAHFWAREPIRTFVVRSRDGKPPPLKTTLRIVDGFLGVSEPVREPDLSDLEVTLEEVKTWRDHTRLDEARSVIGPVPVRFDRSCVEALIGFCNRKRGVHLGEQDIPHTPEGWEELTRGIRTGYITVWTRSLGLVRWLRERIAELRDPVVPAISYLHAVDNNCHMLQIELALSTREQRVTNRQLAVLSELKQSGHAVCARSLKLDLVKRVPELDPWIEPIPSTNEIDVANEATYSLPPAVRGRLDLEA